VTAASGLGGIGVGFGGDGGARWHDAAPEPGETSMISAPSGGAYDGWPLTGSTPDRGGSGDGGGDVSAMSQASYERLQREAEVASDAAAHLQRVARLLPGGGGAGGGGAR